MGSSQNKIQKIDSFAVKELLLPGPENGPYIDQLFVQRCTFKEIITFDIKH